MTTEFGDFHNLSYPDNSFDVVWSQEAFLHGADKAKIVQEAYDRHAAKLADYERAGEWTEASRRWCERQSISNPSSGTAPT